MRATLKGLLESGLLHGGPAAISRARHRDRVLILAYHNVVPETGAGAGDRSLHLPLASFRDHLTALQERADVVPLGPSLLGDGSRDPGRPRVAITFDDAYRGAVTLALPELARRGMPATVFVSPGRLGGQAFWWDRYAGVASELPDADDFRETALLRLGGAEDLVAEWAAARGWKGAALPDAMLSADERELEVAAAFPGLTIASHTWSHPNLTQLDDAALDHELARSLAWLRAWRGSVLAWLAYPYGIENAKVAVAAAKVGYEAAVRVDGGWLPRGGHDRFRLPRLNVPAGLSEAGFRLRLAGLPGRRP